MSPLHHNHELDNDAPAFLWLYMQAAFLHRVPADLDALNDHPVVNGEVARNGFKVHAQTITERRENPGTKKMTGNNSDYQRGKGLIISGG